MMGHTHMTFGALFATSAVHFGYAEPSVAFFLGALFGSLAPDLDHPSALLSKKIPLSGETFGLLKHRTITHSILGLVIVYAFGIYIYPLLAEWLNAWLVSTLPQFADTQAAITSFSAEYLGTGFLIGFIIGQISHIVIDLFNPQGVQLFYPFDFIPNKGWVRPPFGLGIPTGSIWELLFMVVTLVVVAYLDVTLGLVTALVSFLFWFIIGKPGIPRYKL